MTSTRRAFLSRFGIGSLITGSLLATGLPTKAQGTCRRVSGAGSYLVGPFKPLEGSDPIFLVADLGFDETMVFCTIRTNYAGFIFPTFHRGDVRLGINEFSMDMQSVLISSVDVQDSDDGPQAVYAGTMRSETRLFSGANLKTITEGHASFGCSATQLNAKSGIEVSKTNFSMTANFDPKGDHAAIFGAKATFAGHLARGNIVVMA